MTAPAGEHRNLRFFLCLLALAVLVAGGLSYVASSAPDGLDTVTVAGCEVGADEQLEGTCIARNAQDHPLGDGPLADYAVRGAEGTVGVAGVIGVVVTLAVACGLFWLLRRRDPVSTPTTTTRPTPDR